MIKLYKKIGINFYYQEAWRDGNKVVLHSGTVGSTGNKLKRHKWDDCLDLNENLMKWLHPAIENGFTEIKDDEKFTLVVEYKTDDKSTDYLSQRHKLEDMLNEHLGWTALGHVDGGSIGSGTMEIFCIVVDYEQAKQSIDYRLSTPEYEEHKNFNRIYQMELNPSTPSNPWWKIW